MEHHSRHVYIEGNGKKVVEVKYIASGILSEEDVDDAMVGLAECENDTIETGFQPCGVPFVIGNVIIQKMVREA